LNQVFDTPPQELWKTLIRQRIRWQERILADAPDDIASN
jgi:hypothetical protein